MLRNLKNIIYLLIVSGTLLGVSMAEAATCDPGLALSRAKWASFGKTKHIISVEPFEDQSKNKSEPWLSNGIAEMFTSFLSVGKHTGIVSGIIRKYPPKHIQPRVLVKGSYQVIPQGLRIYVKVLGSDGLRIFQDAFSVAPTGSGKIFVQVGKAARNILDAANISYNKKDYQKKFDVTSDYLAYQAYIKGLEAMWKFDKNYNDVAKIWFQESRKHDIYFMSPYFAEEDLYGYQAMIAKALGNSYSQLLENIESIESQRIRFAVRPSAVPSKKAYSVKKLKNIKVTNRYLKANGAWLAAEAALMVGNTKEGVKQLENNIKFTPEDILAYRKLATIYASENKLKKAQEIGNRGQTLGICY